MYLINLLALIGPGEDGENRKSGFSPRPSGPRHRGLTEEEAQVRRWMELSHVDSPSHSQPNPQAIRARCPHPLRSRDHAARRFLDFADERLVASSAKPLAIASRISRRARAYVFGPT